MPETPAGLAVQAAFECVPPHAAGLDFAACLAACAAQGIAPATAFDLLRAAQPGVAAGLAKRRAAAKQNG